MNVRFPPQPDIQPVGWANVRYRPIAGIRRTPYYRVMTTVLIDIILSATTIGFVVGHVRRRRSRWMAYGATLLAPMLVLTAVLATSPSGNGSFMAWRMVGMVMVGPVVAAWIVFAATGFAAARWSVR